LLDHQPVDGRSVEALSAALRAAAAGRDEPVLIISADAMSTHQSVINVLDAARRAGLARLTFAAQSGDAKTAR
jgi:biopolymer transport protein ExbD